MRQILLLLILFKVALALSQKNNHDNKPYRIVPVYEKSLIRIDDILEADNNYKYLMKERRLKQELLIYFQSYIPTLSNITKMEIKNEQNLYYLVLQTNTHTIVSLLHLVTILRSEATFFMLGKNHCINQHPFTSLCFPKDDGLTCLNKQNSCLKFVRYITIR
ncbi:hypothetical protein [Myroides sp. LoEW2-1]|uniref:hypothetical protein n=1 Tax=Myroides sp. LoEW2-1 TaxID=2683192 RepID=UPI00132AC6A9|nr:hypothetical protein [Myroides sp. LoEW2-1]MVX34372.1 hypothetical protein [Myroides sp. LoEW2-1]